MPAIFHRFPSGGIPRWQGKIYRRAIVEDAFRPHPPAMAAGDALDDGKSNAGAFKFLNAMKTLEHAEQIVRILHVKADAIIFHKVNSFVSLDVSANLNLGRLFEAAELDCVGQ